jgi:hypothetical protein
MQVSFDGVLAGITWLQCRKPPGRCDSIVTNKVTGGAVEDLRWHLREPRGKSPADRIRGQRVAQNSSKSK